MFTASRRHYDSIQQLAREDCPVAQPGLRLGDNVFEQVGTFHALPNGTIVPDGSAR